MKAERWRIRVGDRRLANPALAQLAGSSEDGWNGDFLVPLDGELWHVRLSDGIGWRHLSVSNAQKKMLPTWNIMCRLKACFFADDVWVVQYHPAQEDYINDHPFTLHLWEPLNEELPKPPVFMV